MDIRVVIEQLEVYKVKKRKECRINCMFYTSNSFLRFVPSLSERRVSILEEFCLLQIWVIYFKSS